MKHTAGRKHIMLGLTARGRPPPAGLRSSVYSVAAPGSRFPQLLLLYSHPTHLHAESSPFLRKEFIRGTEQTVLIRCRAWSDQHTDQQRVYYQTALLVSLPLHFPMSLLLSPYFMFSPALLSERYFSSEVPSRVN